MYAKFQNLLKRMYQIQKHQKILIRTFLILILIIIFHIHYFTKSDLIPFLLAMINEYFKK